MSRKELKKQTFRLINSLNVEQLKASIEILQLIQSNNGIQIHIPTTHFDEVMYCHTNVTNNFLKITSNDSNIGPKTVPTTHRKIKVDKLLHDYILTHGQPYIASDNHILKTIKEVLFHKGDIVVYQGYLFYIYYLGSVCTLYVSEKDLKEEMNGFCICSSELHRIVPINNLEEELKLCISRHQVWDEEQYYDSSSIE